MYFRYTQASLPQDAVKAKVIKKEITEDFPLVVTKDVTFDDVTAPTKFIPERRYWTSHFESSLQVAQNYISPNWHKGGASSLNLNHYEFLKYDYKRDRIKITNTLKIKNNIYTAPNDTLRSYKVMWVMKLFQSGIILLILISLLRYLVVLRKIQT